ncbi:probable LRR receptor-like serine/threonine-protein kinase At3g47570 [Telopea speciosissima]|uniref:probable LRR receptor-like serine/threonine-protein kinase At3g47570 n=1 Tax=Telopea speciosissima TaxID=54955 RepID=UPI001CC5F16A|nr:probable LRR receptor-like serine/threonine-protein kinase At3g47570 [Telopea speciosissima]
MVVLHHQHLILLVVFNFLLLFAAESVTLDTDRLALLEFKKQITDDPYGALSSWNDSIHFCNWVGITCGHLHPQQVINLDLQGKGLGGSISPSIGNLTFLSLLTISNNRFHGQIPQEIGNLNRLQIISFANNTLGGELPTSLPNCTRLREIYFFHNNLVGKIPVELFTSLSKLEIISINENDLTGEIPASFGNISSVRVISLAGNKLQGSIPDSFGQLTNLFYLSLGLNNLFGMFPVSLYNLSSLQTIDIVQGQVHGSLPRDIVLTLPNLQILLIAENLFSGSILGSISNISTIKVLELGSNSFVGSIPNKLGDLQNLQLFLIDQFGGGKVDDLDFVNPLVNCTLLELLDIEGNSFRGLIPNFKANLSTQLSILHLGMNQISGNIPAGIENLVNLTSLAMEQNFLEGNIPSVIGKLPKLQRLFLGDNRLSGQIPSSIGNLTNLYELHLENNNLNASIPSSIGNCQHLQSKSKPPSTPLIGVQFLKLSYRKLFQATGGFSPANFIGSGSFGSVCKGIIDQDETIVAVKVPSLQNSRVDKSFSAECKALRNIRHRNLVKILSSCSSLDSKGKDFKALVYEFMPNGNLDNWLHLPMEAQYHSRNLSLLQRLNIAIDVASALDYLHYHCHAPIVHCDLKLSNVLLDNDMIAHVSDFGLARLLLEPDDDSSQTQTSTIGIKGSIGYVAPEYGMGGRATIQGDVFSYGILLLEMFTRKRPTD